MTLATVMVWYNMQIPGGSLPNSLIFYPTALICGSMKFCNSSSFTATICPNLHIFYGMKFFNYTYTYHIPMWNLSHSGFHWFRGFIDKSSYLFFMSCQLESQLPKEIRYFQNVSLVKHIWETNVNCIPFCSVFSSLCLKLFPYRSLVDISNAGRSSFGIKKGP